MNLEFVVKDVINEPDGKWSEELGGVMLIESKFIENYIEHQMGPQLDRVVMVLQTLNYVHFAFIFGSNYLILQHVLCHFGKQLIQHFEEEEIESIEGVINALITASMDIEEEHRDHPERYNKIDSLLSQFKINHFAQFTIFNAEDRLSIYQLNYRDIGTEFMRFGSKMMDTLYALDMSVTAPILETMQILSFIKMLLNSIMTSMSSIIAVLSSIIIYCLMIIDVENGIFECGVLRSIGMMKSSLIWILNMLFFTLSLSLGVWCCRSVHLHSVRLFECTVNR